MVTPYGDYIAFRDADSWGDYAIATAGVLPFAKYIKVAGKVVKVETKAAQTLVKDAEAAYKAGNVAEGNRLMNQVVSQSTQVETTVVKNSTLTSKMPSNPGSQAGSGEEKPTDYLNTNGSNKASDTVGTGKQKDEQIWTETNKKDPVENAYSHWDKHKLEFPEFQNAKQYVDATHNFVNNPPAGTLVITRKNGDTVFYNPSSNIFAVKNADGTSKTMFKPNPAEHGIKLIWNILMHKNNNEAYICRVCGLKQNEPQWGIDEQTPTYNICDCCGVEFGYEDCTLIGIKSYRKKWLDGGAKWNCKKCQPNSWSLNEQLANIPKQYQ